MMKKTPFIKPYKPDNSTNLLKFKGKKGVYVIKEAGKGKSINYVGYSGSDLYKTIIRHFQVWNDRTNQYRATYNRKNHVVRVILCSSTQEAVDLEDFLQSHLRPTDNRQILYLYPKGSKKYKNISEKYENAEDLPF